jgi:hypothetical protein
MREIQSDVKSSIMLIKKILGDVEKEMECFDFIK